MIFNHNTSVFINYLWEGKEPFDIENVDFIRLDCMDVDCGMAYSQSFGENYIFYAVN